METVIAVALAALVVLVAFYVLRARGSAARAQASSGRGGPGSGAPMREASLSNLGAGDVLVFWDHGDRIVSSVLRCREEVGGRTTEWRWAFIDDGRLIESAPDGVRLFEPLEIIYQGSADFERLVPPAGALGVFEERVRAGGVGRNPVQFDYGERVYRVASTGTFAASVDGEPVTSEVWRDLSADPTQNVYFELELAGTPPVGGNGNGAHQAQPVGEKPRQGDEELLGIWTTHIWLGRGRKLSDADIAALYGKG